MTALWVLLAALVGGFAGGVAARNVGKWAARRREARGQGWHGSVTSTQGGEEAKELQLIHDKLWKISDSVGRILQEVSPLAGKIDEVAEGVKRPPPPAPPQAVPERPDAWGKARQPALPSPAPFPPERQPVAIVAAPPPNAISVEARDDRIVVSPGHPPEAWLEPRGPAAGQLWLNPAVALNENALRRLSTFFRWESERPGAQYETATPATIQWDESRRTGTVLQRGAARPR